MVGLFYCLHRFWNASNSSFTYSRISVSGIDSQNIWIRLSILVNILGVRLILELWTVPIADNCNCDHSWSRSSWWNTLIHCENIQLKEQLKLFVTIFPAPENPDSLSRGYIWCKIFSEKLWSISYISFTIAIPCILGFHLPVKISLD